MEACSRHSSLARRSSLTELSEVWIAEIKNPESKIVLWPPSHLELIARFPKTCRTGCWNAGAIVGAGTFQHWTISRRPPATLCGCLRPLPRNRMTRRWCPRPAHACRASSAHPVLRNCSPMNCRKMAVMPPLAITAWTRPAGRTRPRCSSHGGSKRCAGNTRA